jgi:hypothetical protein
MEGDPVVRWRVLRDVLDASEAEVDAERARIATEGWGAFVLSKQDDNGTWGNSFYGRKWTSTFYSMLLLKEFGLDGSNEQAERGARVLFENGWRDDGGLRYGPGPTRPSSRKYESETCISGMGLGILSRFGCAQEELEPLVAYLLGQQMPDGGWNCQYPGATHASFNTTILTLEGLAEWEAVFGPRPEVSAARRRGEEFLLVHRLFRSHTTGEVISAGWLRPAWPGTWHYDILRGLEYLTASGVHDERMTEAIDILRSKQRSDGRWPRGSNWPAKTWSDFEAKREPGRWTTVRALTVLRKWDASDEPGRRPLRHA